MIRPLIQAGAHDPPPATEHALASTEDTDPARLEPGADGILPAQRQKANGERQPTQART